MSALALAAPFRAPAPTLDLRLLTWGEVQTQLPLATPRKASLHIVWITAEKRGAAWIFVTGHVAGEAKRQPQRIQLVEHLVRHLNQFLAWLTVPNLTVEDVVEAKAKALSVALPTYDQLPITDSELAIGLGLILEYVRSVEFIAHQFLLGGPKPRTIRLHGGCAAVAASSPAVPHCPYGVGAPVYNVITRTLQRSKAGTALPEEIAAIFRLRPAQLGGHITGALQHLRAALEHMGFDPDEAIAYWGRH